MEPKKLILTYEAKLSKNSNVATYMSILPESSQKNTIFPHI